MVQHVFATAAQKNSSQFRGSSAPAGIGSRFKVGNGEEIDLGSTYEGIIVQSFVFQCSGYNTGDNLYGNIWNASGNSLIASPAVDGGVDTSSPFTEKTFQITDIYLPAASYFAGFSRLSGDWMAWDEYTGSANLTRYTSAFGASPDGLSSTYSGGCLVGYLNYTKYNAGTLAVSASQTGDKEVTLDFTGLNGTNTKDYEIHWGDGSVTTGSVAPDTGITNKVHTYTTTGSKTITIYLDHFAPETGVPRVTLTDTITVSTIPGAPASITATPAVGRIDVAWTAPASNGGSAITGYEYSTNGTSWASAGTSPLEIAGAAGTPITAYIRAVNAWGPGPSVNATATPFSGPGAPVITSITPGLTSASVAFTAGSNGGTPITDYEYSLDGTNYFALGDTTSPVTIPSLTKFTTYTVRLRAVNAAGSGPNDSDTFTTYGGRLKYYTGSAWVARWPKLGSGFGTDIPVKVYNGSSWNTTDV